MNEIASETGTSVSIKSFGFIKAKNQFVGLGVVGINIEIKSSQFSAHSKTSGFSPVTNPIDQILSFGNLTNTTLLKELEF